MIFMPSYDAICIVLEYCPYQGILVKFFGYQISYFSSVCFMLFHFLLLFLSSSCIFLPPSSNFLISSHTLSIFPSLLFMLLKYVTGYGKTDHFAHYFKIELLVFKGSVDLKQ